MKRHVPNGVLGMQLFECRRIEIIDVLRHVDLHIHFLGIESTVSGELQHRFLEMEITPVTHDGGDPFPFRIQVRRGELIPLMDLAVTVFSNLPHILPRDVHFVMPQMIRCMRGNEIGEVDLTTFDLLNRVHFGLEITHVIHLLLELLHADACQVLIIDDGRFTHLMGIFSQAFLGLGRRICRSGVIHIQL